jgi:hypothetical protein
MRWLLNRYYSLILFVSFAFYAVLYVFTWIIIPAWGPSWVYWVSFFGRKIAPILLLTGFFAISFFGENGRMGSFLKYASYATLTVVGFILIFLLAGYFSGVQFETFTFGGNWNYIPCFEYGAFLIGGFYFIGKKQGYTYYSFMLLSLALFAAGFLYELPVIFKAEAYQPFHMMHPLFTSPNIIASVALVILLYFNKAKIGFTQIAAFTLFFTYSTLIFLFALTPSFYAFHFPLGYSYHGTAWFLLEGWLPRIPALIFVTSLVYGAKK